MLTTPFSKYAFSASTTWSAATLPMKTVSFSVECEYVTTVISSVISYVDELTISETLHPHCL